MRGSPAFSLPSGSKTQAGLLTLALLYAGAVPGAYANDCVLLETVTVASSPVLRSEHARQLTEPFLGHCIDAALIQGIITELSGYFVEQGFVTTRPYLREQDIGDGEIEIEVLVGRIEAVIDADTGVGNASISGAFAFNDEILNLRQLETSLEAIERPESVQASFEIRPGSRQGSSVIAIDSVESSPLNAELGINARTDLDPQLSFLVALDNPLNVNDIIEFRYNSGDLFQAYQSDRSRELEYSLQFGGTLVTLGVGDLRYKQRLQGFDGSFLSEGESEREWLRVSHLLSRSQAYRLSLGFGLVLEDNRNFFEEEIIEVSSYKTSKAEIELRHDWFADWGQLLTRYGYQQGLDSFGARDDDFFSAGDDGETSARLQFSKHILHAQSYLYLPDPAWYLQMNLHLQYSNDLLYDSDKLFLGSENTVRGYTSALSGSNGWYARSDIVRRWQSVSSPFAGKALAKSIAVSLGLDYGDIRCEADNPDVCGEIYAIAAGVTISDDNFSALLSWGHPLRELDDDIGSEDVFLLDLRWGL